MRWASGLTCGFLAALSLHACTTPHRAKMDDVAPADMAGHWVQSAQLRKIMDELESLSAVSWPQELEGDSKPSPRQLEGYAQAMQRSQGLSSAADAIPQAVADVRMPEADRRGFLAQVDTLKDQAARLGQAASARDAREMERLLNGIDETCMSCHDRFRDLSGPLNP